MSRDDIIRMARDAGSIDSEEVIETLWKAFVAAEREALKEERRRDMKEIYSLREAEESLREEVERLIEQHAQQGWEPFNPVDESLRRENERLREALTVAAKAELVDPDTGIIDADVFAVVQDTARAALRREEPK